MKRRSFLKSVVGGIAAACGLKAVAPEAGIALDAKVDVGADHLYVNHDGEWWEYVIIGGRDNGGEIVYAAPCGGQCPVVIA